MTRGTEIIAIWYDKYIDDIDCICRRLRPKNRKSRCMLTCYR